LASELENRRILADSRPGCSGPGHRIQVVGEPGFRGINETIWFVGEGKTELREGVGFLRIFVNLSIFHCLWGVSGAGFQDLADHGRIASIF
jgi:hypothetical protein